ncbi:hypothetical protein PAGL106935_20245 [Paenibacillus glucanolyticus]
MRTDFWILCMSVNAKGTEHKSDSLIRHLYDSGCSAGISTIPRGSLFYEIRGNAWRRLER